MPRKAILLIGVAAVSGIAAFVLYAMEGTRLAIREAGAQVQGSVLRSWSTKGKRGRVEYWVDYTYQVDGAAYKGEERHVNGPLGGPIKVWYDPASPDRCVSDPELRYGKDLKFTFMLAFVSIFALAYAGQAIVRHRRAA